MTLVQTELNMPTFMHIQLLDKHGCFMTRGGDAFCHAAADSTKFPQSVVRWSSSNWRKSQHLRQSCLLETCDYK